MIETATSSQVKKFNKEVLSFIASLFREDPFLSNKIVIQTIKSKSLLAAEEVEKIRQGMFKKQQKAEKLINILRDFEQLGEQNVNLLRKFAELKE